MVCRINLGGMKRLFSSIVLVFTALTTSGQAGVLMDGGPAASYENIQLSDLFHSDDSQQGHLTLPEDTLSIFLVVDADSTSQFAISDHCTVSFGDDCVGVLRFANVESQRRARDALWKPV